MSRASRNQAGRGFRRRAARVQGVVHVQASAAHGEAGVRGQPIDRTEQRLFQVRGGQVAERQHERRGSGHMRRRHRRAARVVVGVADRCRQDVLARCGEVNRRGAVVREPREVVEIPGRRDRDDVRRVEAGRVERQNVVIEAVVARAGDEQHVRAVGGIHLIEQRLRKFRPAPAVREDPNVGAAGRGEGLLGRDGKLHGRDRIRRGAAAQRVEKLDAHQPGRPVDAGDPDSVVPHCPDRAGDMRPVTLVVHRIARVGDRVEAVRACRAGDRAPVNGDRERRRRRPHVGREILVRVVDSRIDDGDDVRVGADGKVPGRRRVNAVEPPQFRKAGIVRRRGHMDDEVRLGVDDVVAPCEPLEQRGGAQSISSEGEACRRGRFASRPRRRCPPPSPTIQAV